MAEFDVRDLNAGEGKDTGKTSAFVTVSRVFLLLEIIALVALAFYIYSLSLIPDKYFGLGFALLALIAAIQAVLLIGRQRGLGKAAFSFVISILFIAAEIFAFVFLLYTHFSLSRINETTDVTVTETMNVYVRTADPYEEISELKGHVFGALELMDAQNTTLAVSRLGEELGEEINVTKIVGVYPLVEALGNGSVDAIIINSGYRDSITAGDEDFDSWAKLLYSFEIERLISDAADAASGDQTLADTVTGDISSGAPVEDITIEPFIIYISGMDNRGSQIVAEVGNSDVNMLMVVNPNTYKILLVNTPRDFYYYLYGDTSFPDKLTHTGYYGVDCGVTTLNSIYGININYYVKVGFNSVINIVNALGGITVYSEYAFSQDGYSFSVGDNYLDGSATLAFARNRKSLPGGDRQRGKNQQAVITALINKLTTSAALANYPTLLEAVSSNTVTNFPVDDIYKMIRLQLEKEPVWQIESISVDGTSDRQYCYSLGSSNDVLVPDWSTVEAAKAEIYAVLNGE